MSATLVAQTLRQLQKNSGISCRELSKAAGVCPSAISRYGLGNRELPEDIVVNLANKVGMEELKIAYLAEKKLDIINAPVMNNIDDNIQTMILRFVNEEIPEAIEALYNISKLTMNKKVLLKDEFEELYKEVEQVVDLVPGIKTFLIRLKQTYNLNLERVDAAECRKLRQRRYVIDDMEV